MNFETRVRSVQEVIRRARTVFLVANLATVIALATLFNTYGSWLRHIPDREGLDPVRREAFVEGQVRDLMVVSVPVLGLKFFAADLGIVSSGGMLIIAVWMYYAFRREQHSVGRIILDVASLSAAPSPLKLSLIPDRREEAQFLLSELSAAFVFVTTEKDRAVGDPARELYPGEGPPAAVLAKNWLLTGPAWIVLLCCVLDAASLALPSVIHHGERVSLWSRLNGLQQAEAAARIALAVVMFGVIVRILQRARYFNEWTQRFYRALASTVLLGGAEHESD
jgi:hypothetical protein